MANFRSPKNVSSDLQGYVLAVKVDGLVFAACLAAEDVSFLFIRIASISLIHSTHDSFERLLSGRRVQCLNAAPVFFPVCTIHANSPRFYLICSFWSGTSALSSRLSGEGG